MQVPGGMGLAFDPEFSKASVGLGGSGEGNQSLNKAVAGIIDWSKEQVATLFNDKTDSLIALAPAAASRHSS